VYVKKPLVVKVKLKTYRAIVYVKMKIVFGIKELINVSFNAEKKYSGLKKIDVWNNVMHQKD
jgi:hypothetical protein